MYCSKCGKKIEDGQRFCNYCGNDMSTIRKLADEANELLEKTNKALGEEVESITKDITGNRNNNTQANTQNVNNQNGNANFNQNVNNNNNQNNNNSNNQQTYDAGINPNTGMPRQAVKDNRSLGVYILLCIVTCGIYGLYFIYKLAQDLNEVCDDNEKTAGLLTLIVLTIVTCGIYYYIWLYKVGNRIQRNARNYDLFINENGTTLLVWNLIGVLACGIGPFVGMYILIKNANMLFNAYNKRYGLIFIN